MKLNIKIASIKRRIKRNFFNWQIYLLPIWLFICLLFSKPINYTANSIGSFLFQYDKIILYDLLVVIIAVLFWLVRIKNDIYKCNWRSWPQFMLLFFILWYIPNRIGLEPKIKFIHSSLGDWINLLDILFVLLVIEIGIERQEKNKYLQEKIKLRKNINSKKELSKNSSFITDIAFSPKINQKKDVLGFANFAERIAREVKNVSSSESVVFGINGEWGEGKTSMINLIRQQLEDEKYMVVDFHPWKTNSGKAMNQLFFDALKDGLKNKIWGINWQIDRYADALLQLDKTGISKTIWQIFFQPDSVEKQKEKLAESMKLLDKNLVVVVDDLDRLAKNEIADVLKLMRDTANFPNLVFLAAYDRAYLDEAIKSEINPYNFKNYMDKIVLWEAPIYRPQSRRYLDVLFSTLKEKKDIIPESDIDKLIFATSKTVQSLKEEDRRKNVNTEKQEHTKTPYEIHSTIFTNLRDVKRFCNYLIFNYKAVVFINEEGKKESRVNFEDFYYLYLLRHFYSDYYEQFHLAYHQLFKDRKSGKIETNFEKYKDLISNNIPENEGDDNSEIPYSIIQRIVFNSGSPDAKSIICYKNFLDYFYLGNHEDFSMAQLSAKLKAYTLEDFKAKSTEITDEKIVSQFNWDAIIHAHQSNFQLNRENIDLYAQQLIWLSISVNHPHFYQEIHTKLLNIVSQDSFDREDIKTNIWHFIVAEQLEKKIQNLIFHIIHDYKSEYLSKGHTDHYYIDISKAIEISRTNFRAQVRNSTRLSLRTVALFYCSYQELDNHQILVLNIEVIESMKQLALKYPADFLNFLIIKEYQNFLGSSTPTIFANRFSEALLAIFNDDYNEFKSYLKDLTQKHNDLKTKAQIYLKYADRAFRINEIKPQESFYPDETDKHLFKEAYFIDELQLHL